MGALVIYYSFFLFFLPHFLRPLTAYAKSRAALALVHLLRASASGDNGVARKVRTIPGRSVCSLHPASGLSLAYL